MIVVVVVQMYVTRTAPAAPAAMIVDRMMMPPRLHCLCKLGEGTPGMPRGGAIGLGQIYDQGVDSSSERMPGTSGIWPL